MILRTKIIIAVACVLTIIAAYAIYMMLDENDTIGQGNHSPHAVINAPSEAILSQPVVFSGVGSYDDDGDELTYFWEFDDGSNTTGPVVEHTFTVYYGELEQDTHKVNLTVFDGEYEDIAYFAVTVIILEEAPDVLLSSDSISDIFYGITYIVEVEYISEGDANIDNISYHIVSAETGEELINGTVREADESSMDDSVSYWVNQDDYMEAYEYFKVLSEPLNTVEGDYFYLYHIPTGIKMGECQLSG